jgi:hypothetical protein
VSKDKKTGTVPVKMTGAPEKPGAPVFLWAGIALAASGSLFFNLYHDTNALAVLLIAIPAGVIPPLMTVFLAHAIKEVTETWTTICVFAVTLLMMAVSAKGSAPVLAPAYGELGAYSLSIALDGSDLLLLFALIQHYKKVREYKLWLTAPDARYQPAVPAAGGTDLRAGTGGTNRLAPTGTGLVVPVPAPVVPAVPGGTVTTVPASAPHAIPAKGSGTSQQPAGGKQPPGNRRKREADPELCERVVREFAAAHPRPGAESIDRRRIRAEKFLAEFRERTGERANNQEIAKALQVHPKRDIPEIRAGITEPEGERGEETG